MMELNSLRVDPKKSLDGAWIDYINGTRLLIARYDNKAMQSYRHSMALEHVKIFTNFEENQDEALRLTEEIDVKAIAHYVLLDLEGFTENGEPLVYTPELGIKILSDESYAEFREFVVRVARNAENYRVESEAEAAEVVKDTAVS